MEERPFRIREVEGSNPSVSSFSVLSVAQLVEHVTVDVCDHRVAGSIPAAETFRDLRKPPQAVTSGGVCSQPCTSAGVEPSDGTSAKIGTIQRRLAWSLRKDDTH